MMSIRSAMLGAFALLAAAAACGSSKRAGNGAECFVASDCQEPLVCVEQKDKTRRCTDNLDSVVGALPPEAGPPTAEADAEAEPSDSGGAGGGGEQ